MKFGVMLGSRQHEVSAHVAETYTHERRLTVLYFCMCMSTAVFFIATNQILKPVQSCRGRANISVGLQGRGLQPR